MTSGIYKITFPSGKTYVGKSVDIPTRWKQHFDKFNKGTAAGPMQAEYDKYGKYNQEVIFECHEDHIDLAEAYLIYKLNPELNTSRPKNPFSKYKTEDINRMCYRFQESTMEHIAYIEQLEDTVLKQKDLLDTPIVEELKLKDAQIKALRQRIVQLETPWWHRLF